MRTDGPRLLREFLTLARDDAAATVKANRLNAQLPPGVAPIVVVGVRMRNLPQEPRKVISEQTQELWVDIRSRQPVGDQDSVVEGADGSGVIAIGPSIRAKCVRRRFTVTKFLPPTWRDATIGAGWAGELGGWKKQRGVRRRRLKIGQERAAIAARAPLQR